MPVCIGGMHRSGTSMVANLLHGCGLYLGPDRELLGAMSTNRRGHWENQQFTRINEEILRQLGGNWYAPPEMPADWHEKGVVADYRTKAISLCEQFDGHEPWGWKDPRNSLTLALWRSLMPDLKVVICVRNPLEVVSSLRRRELAWRDSSLTAWQNCKRLRFNFYPRRRLSFSFTGSLKLWTTYNQRILDSIPPSQLIITHYEAYFRDPQKELLRVLNFLGMKASDEALAKCGSMAIPDLRNNLYTTEQLREARVPPGVFDLYLRMCEEANFPLLPPHEELK